MCGGCNREVESLVYGYYNKVTCELTKTHCKMCAKQSKSRFVSNHGLPKFSTPEGKERIQRLGMHRWNFPPETYCFKEEWKVRNNRSKIKLYCVKCEQTVESTSISNHLNHGVLGCSCRTALPWKGEDGYARFMKRMMQLDWPFSKETYQKLTQEWWLANVEDHNSKLCLYCDKCEQTVESTSISNHLDYRKLGCGCHTQLPWKGEDGYARFMERVTQPDRPFTKETYQGLTLEWWLANVEGQDSNLRLHCVKCDQTVESTSIGNHLKHAKLGCSCRFKTEHAFGKYLQDKWIPQTPGAQLLSDKPGHASFPWLLGNRRFDFAWELSCDSSSSTPAKGIEEIDGRQHFVDYVFDKTSTAEQRQHKDGEKCRLALENGFWVIRYDQRWMWDTMRKTKPGKGQVEWERFRVRALHHVQQGGPPKVLLPEVCRTQVYDDTWIQNTGLNDCVEFC